MIMITVEIMIRRHHPLRGRGDALTPAKYSNNRYFLGGSMAPACVGGRRFGLERFEGEFRCRGFVLESSTQKSKLHEKGRQRSGEQSAASTRSGASSIIMSRGASPVVLPLQQLPEALQQHLAEQLPDATTAGRLAQVSQGFKLLLQPRLAALKEAARRLADKQAAR